MSDYYVPQHVHFAIEGDVVVFLDLRRDEYSMILGAKARAFTALVSDANNRTKRLISIDDSATDAQPSARHQIVAELLENKLLTTANSDTKSSFQKHIHLPEEALIDEWNLPQPHVRMRDLARFLLSCAIAKWRLDWTGIERTVRSVERRNQLNRNGGITDILDLRRLVLIYMKLRSLLPRDARCLYDSLSLLEFLARYGYFPTWVFAVRFEPWGAHCWVQCDTVSINQDADEARTYLPLMAI